MEYDRNQRLKVTINSNTYLIEINDLKKSPITVKVNGQTYSVDIELADKSPGETPTTTRADPTHYASLSERKATTVGLDGANEKVVRAPMPGNVIHMAVKAGDHVSVGQELCSLEAMKMNNAIRSPCDGVIASTVALPGQAVNHGDILLTFE